MPTLGIILIGIAIFFFLLILISPKKSKTNSDLPDAMNPVGSALEKMRERGWSFLVRPSGNIDGIIIDDDEYFHEKMGTHRRKWIYYGLDGEKRQEGRYLWNSTSQSLDDLRAIGGGSGNIVLTMRKNHAQEPDEGDKEPVLVGQQARQKVDVEETFEAIKDEQVRTIEGLQAKEEDYKEVARKYAKAQDKIEKFQSENEEYHEAISDQSRLIDKLKSENEDLEAELEEKKKRLEQKRKELKKVEEEVDDTLEKARERGEKKVEAEEARS